MKLDLHKQLTRFHPIPSFAGQEQEAKNVRRHHHHRRHHKTSEV